MSIKYLYLYIITYVNISAVLGQMPVVVPQSPCRDIFGYKFENNVWFADFKIVPPSLKKGYAVVEAQFSIGVHVPDGVNFGSLLLLDDKSKIYEKFKRHIPLDYRVIFPYRNILPYLTALILNGKLICDGPKDPNLTRTGYRLIHELTLSNSNKNEMPGPIPNALPLQIMQVKPSPIPQYFQTKPSSGISTPHTNVECGIIENPSSHPWLVGLFQHQQFFCSGSLISTKHVITAAHCTTVQFQILVKLGSNDATSYIDRNSISRFAKNVTTHPEYNPQFGYSDISIILLNEVVPTLPNIRPICLWPKENDVSSLTGKLLQLIGWTTNPSDANAKRKPTEINVVVNPLEECDIFDKTFISDKTICASGNSQTMGQCLGNSGGALILSVNNRQMLRGVVSVTNIDSNPTFCNANNYYTLYADVAKHFDWINFTLRLL